VNSERIAEIALLVACSEGFFTGLEQVIQKKGNQRPRQQALIARSTCGSSCVAIRASRRERDAPCGTSSSTLCIIDGIAGVSREVVTQTTRF